MSSFAHSKSELKSLRVELPRDLLAVRRAAGQFRAFLAAHEFPENELWSCELAFVEACNNAVQHGSRSSSTLIRIDISLSGKDLEIRIHDQADFELPEKAVLPDAEKEGGRGLYLIQTLMDQVRCERTGADAMSCLVLRKNITGI